MIRAISVCGFLVSLTLGAIAQPPEFPPGVKLMDEPPAKDSIPESVEVYSLEVNWTHPLLRVRLELGLSPGTDAPRRWQEISPEAFKIQLVEPVQEEDVWKLPLSAELAGEAPHFRQTDEFMVDPPSVPAASMGEDWPDQVRVGGVVGWAVHGARAMRAINSPPLAMDGSSRVNVRWMGQASEWSERAPEFKLESSWMLSTFDPLTGRGEFHFVVNRTGRAVPPSDLRDWIEAAWPQRHVWLAIHSVGSQVMAGIGDWRLGDDDVSRAPTTGRIERMGAVLVLESVKPGEDVDWARLGEISFSASPTLPEHEPEQIIRGLIWPTPMRPVAWVSSNEGKDVEITPYLELVFQAPRPIQRARILHASAAGWSSHFNSQEFQLRLISKAEAIISDPIIVTDIADSDSVISMAEDQVVSAVRIEFTKPAQMDHSRTPARIAGLQLWGPWDGVTGVEN